MKVQILNENLIKALSGIKENQVAICNVIVNRKPLLDALKINKQFDKITLETGKTTWNNLTKNNDYETSTIQNKPCLRISLDHTVMTLFNQEVDYKNPNPAKLSFSNPDEVKGTSLNTKEFINALRYTMPCISSESYESRIALKCLLLDSDNDSLKLVSADGFRLAISKLPANGIKKDKVLIDLNDVKKLMPFLKNNKDENVYIEYLDDTSVKFSTKTSSINFNRVASEFPNYEQLIPTVGLTSNEFISSDMIQAIKSLSNIANDGTNIIRLEFLKVDCYGKICISAKSEEYGDSQIEIDAKVETENKIALKYGYLKELLTLCKDEPITLKINSPSSPMIFDTAKDYRTIIMPMFVQW